MPEHEEKCGNCGMTAGKHYTNTTCPNVDDSSAAGRRGSFKPADGTEVFYNAWHIGEKRWTNASLCILVGPNSLPRWLSNSEGDPYKLNRKEAADFVATLNRGVNDTVFEVRAIGPGNRGLPVEPLVTTPAAAKLVTQQAKAEKEKAKEMAFFRQSTPDNCPKCGAPKNVCTYHS